MYIEEIFYYICIIYKIKLIFIFLINKLKVVLIWVNMLLNVIKSIWLVDIFGVLLIELFFGWINLLYWVWSILEENKRELKFWSI